jgi:glucosylceramidase
MNGGGVRTDQFPALAQYFVKFLTAYRAQGLPVYAVSMQNEPLNPTAGYPSALVTAADEATFLGQYLGPALAGAGLGGVKIIAYDHNWDHPEYPDAVLSDATAGPFVAGAAFHCYGGDVSAQSQLHAKHPDKDIWFTECSGTVGSSFAGDLAWNARNLIIGATRNWARGVTLWNLALDQKSGPQNGGCTNCRGVVTIDFSTTPPNVTRNVEYYVLAHAAKFIQPGAVRIDSANAGSILNVAFQNPDGSIALVVLNDGSAATDFAVSWHGQTFLHTVPTQSLVTFLWRPHK